MESVSPQNTTYISRVIKRVHNHHDEIARLPFRSFFFLYFDKSLRSIYAAKHTFKIH